MEHDEPGMQHTMNQDIQILKERARITAREAESKASGNSLMLVEFLLFPETYAIEAAFVKEVLTLKDITPIPGTPDFVMGVINFRGEIISVVNLKNLFGLKEKGLTEMNKVLLLRNGQMAFGLVADAIIGSQQIQQDELSEPPLTLSKTTAGFVTGTMGNGTIVLSAEHLLSSEQLTVNQ